MFHKSSGLVSLIKSSGLKQEPLKKYMTVAPLRSITARFSLIVAHFRPEIFYWLVQKIRSLSPQKPAITQFHDQK